jgi:hypothetical protein
MGIGMYQWKKTLNCPHKRDGSVNSSGKTQIVQLRASREEMTRIGKNVFRKLIEIMFITVLYRIAFRPHGPMKRTNLKRVGTEV